MEDIVMNETEPGAGTFHVRSLLLLCGFAGKEGYYYWSFKSFINWHVMLILKAESYGLWHDADVIAGSGVNWN